MQNDSENNISVDPRNDNLPRSSASESNNFRVIPRDKIPRSSAYKK